METPLNSSVDVVLTYQGESIHLYGVEFTGTYISEPAEGPTASCGGYPGFVEVQIELTDYKEVESQVVGCVDPSVTFDARDIFHLVVEAVEEKVCESPEDHFACERN